VKKYSIAIDMDHVIADATPLLLEKYKEKTGKHIDEDELVGKKFEHFVPESDREIVWDIINAPGFFRQMEPIPGSQEALRELWDQAEVFIASAAMEFRNSLYDKHCWLEEHFPFISWKNIIFCGAKHFLATDFLIDDQSYNLTKFKGEGILFEAHHNVNDPFSLRVKSWPDAIGLLRRRGVIS
jgi:5'(3')-deoxyribonucleotidase